VRFASSTGGNERQSVERPSSTRKLFSSQAVPRTRIIKSKRLDKKRCLNTQKSPTHLPRLSLHTPCRLPLGQHPNQPQQLATMKRPRPPKVSLFAAKSVGPYVFMHGRTEGGGLGIGCAGHAVGNECSEKEYGIPSKAALWEQECVSVLLAAGFISKKDGQHRSFFSTIRQSFPPFVRAGR